MRIILIGNYTLDKQESMKRFALMLESGFNARGIKTEIWEPTIFFGAASKNTASGIGKWLGYIDKWMLFPLILKIRSLNRSNRDSHTRFHICDHSNAPYLRVLPLDRTAITCHDVLAIRGALGHADAYCPASGMGKILQKWILKNLLKAENLASVSHFTLNQLKDLSPHKFSNNKNWVVIHNGFNADFKPMERTASKPLLEEMGLNYDEPFILHVGSSLERKNRKLLLHMTVALGDKWQGKICFAGKALDPGLLDLIKKLNLQDRVISIEKPNHEQLLALYSSCQAFIFPSLSEGFGWPLIEAQACGAPVIASNLEPMPEVSNHTAIHVDPHDAQGFANAFLTLQNEKIRNQIIEAGFANMERFNVVKMMDSYVRLHQSK